jgi:hypothetical protein
VKAAAKIIDRQFARQTRVDCFHGRARLRPAGDVRLIRHDDEEITSRLQPAQRLRHAGQHLHLVDRGWWIGLPVADEGAIDYTIPVKEDGAAKAGIDSHFVWAALTAGCDTSRCQTIA